MEFWADLDQIPEDWPASTVTIGVFDGVHLGHRELIRVTKAIADQGGVPSVVLTFWPNPAEVVKRSAPPARLTTIEHRAELIDSLGIDAVAVLPFDDEIAHLSPEQFASQILSDKLHASHVVVGENFRFGRRAIGDTTDLEQLGEHFGFRVTVISLVDNNESKSKEPTSSTEIRLLIDSGDVSTAARSLARPHRVEGVVISGDGRGTELGFPTANIDFDLRASIPADGVYVGRLVVDPRSKDHRILNAAISVGTNPTFEGVDERRVEAFAFDEENLDLYGEYCAVEFVARIRGQETFGDVEDLKRAVAQDVEKCREVLGS